MKKKFEIKNIFKTFALAFTTLALMLGVLVSNTLPQVKAEEPSTPDYSTWEKTALQQGDTVYGKYLLFDNGKYKFELEIPSSIDEVFKYEFYLEIDYEPYIHLTTLRYDVPTVDFNTSTAELVNIEGIDYYLVKITDSTLTVSMEGFYPGQYNGYESWTLDLSKATVSAEFDGISVLVEPTVEPETPVEPDEPTVEPETPVEPDEPNVEPETPVEPDEPTVEPDEPTVEPDEPTVEPDEPTVEPDEPTVEPDEPTVEPDEPTVEPDEPTVEPDEPTDDNTQEDNSSDVVEDKDNFVEMVGNTSIVVFGLENISAFTAGIATLGSIALFIIVSAVVIAIIAVSKKR